MRTFETEYQLQEWRKIESEHFDEDGSAYKGQAMARSTQEQMRDLINQLDSELTLIDDKKAIMNRINEIFGGVPDQKNCKTVIEAYLVQQIDYLKSIISLDK